MKSKKRQRMLWIIGAFVLVIFLIVVLFPQKVKSEKPVEIDVSEKRLIVQSVSVDAKFGSEASSTQRVLPLNNIDGIKRNFTSRDEFVSFLNEHNISEFYVIYIMNDGTKIIENFHSTEELFLNLKAIGDELVNDSHKAKQAKVTYKNLITSWNINQIHDDHDNDYHWILKSKNYDAKFSFIYEWRVRVILRGTSSIQGKIINEQTVDIEAKNRH